MSANMYRLYAIQSFGGEKVSIYVNEGRYPNADIISDARKIISGEMRRSEVVNSDPYMYGDVSSSNRRELTRIVKILKRSSKLLNENDNVDKAIFVNTSNKRDWRGEVSLYKNNNFSAIKSDAYGYADCEVLKTIIV